MKPRTIDIILKVCSICVVVALLLIVFFDSIIGMSILIASIAIIVFSLLNAWKSMRADPDAFKALSKNEKELSLKDLPAGLIVLLVVASILTTLGEFRVFSLNPLVETTVIAFAVLLVVYYFFQKRRLRKAQR